MSSKRFYYLLTLLLFSSTLVFVSCKDKDEEEEEEKILIGDWEKLSTMNMQARSEAVSFVIGGMGYVATGSNVDTDPLRDMMAYNPVGDVWTQKASMPEEADARYGAVAFSIDTKAYVGTGHNDLNRLKDFWEYDATANTWKQIDDYPGAAVEDAVAFTLNGKGYVGTGYDGKEYYKDFYEYNQATETWTTVLSNCGKLKDACAFVIDNKAYILTGVYEENNSVSQNNTIYMFDGTNWNDEYNKITNSLEDETFDDEYISLLRNGAVAFSINNKGYLVSGRYTSLVQAVWEFDPGNEPGDDRWTEKTGFQGILRTEAVGFVIDDKGYVTTGRGNGSIHDDILSFDPDKENDQSL